MNSITLDDVIGRLQREKGRWARIAEQTGVPYSTLSKIGQGKRRNPTLNNFSALAAWMTANPEPQAVVPQEAA